jgi:PAS domain S-box-containing protein
MAKNMADTYTDPTERSAFIAALEAAGGRLVDCELTRRTPEGVHKHILTSASMDGDVLTGVVVDVTDRKRAEESLRDGEARYRRVVETAAEGIWVLGAEHRTTFVNRAMTEMLGYAAEEMLGRPLLAFVMPADRDKVAEAMGRRMQGTAERLERRFRRKDGGELIAMVNVTPLRDGSGRLLGSFGMVTDITARIAAEEALRTRARQLETVRGVAEEITRELALNRLLDLITRRTIELVGADSGGVHLWDEAALALVPQVTAGMTLAPWQAEIRYRLGEGVVGAVAARREGMIVNDYRAWAGAHPAFLARTNIGAVLAEPLMYQGQLLGVLAVTRSAGRPFTEDDQRLLRLFADQAAIAVQNAQLYESMHQAFQDLRRAQDELLQSQKLRALGQLAAGIAHDLNNMLAAVLGQIELLKIRVAYPEVREALATLETAATDGAEIVRRIQDFARQRAASHLASCNLETIVAEAVEITRPRWKDEADRRGVAIALHLALEELPQILGNPPEIREALTNLIFNAVDAMPEGGEIEIRGTADEESVLLSIRDTGSGMPDEVRSRVFEPFFTTKGVRGAGLGLSLVYGIMERHGGRVDVQSSPGKGSTFTLQFQRAHEAGGPMRPAAAASLPAPRRILLVDDDAMVRRTMATLLQAVGQQVTEVDGGAAALAALASAPFDLVFTDLGMPEMTGWQVAEAIKARHPALPVVLITGWQDQVGTDAEQRRSVDAVLPKPSRLEDLLRVIRELSATPNR